MDDLTSRWDRATFLFDAADYIGAARLLAEIVGEAPDNSAARLLLARAYYHSAQLRLAEDELAAVVPRCRVTCHNVHYRLNGQAVG